MPIIDMPIEKLKQYDGVNPCPEDFDAFWDASLEEMRAVEPQVTFIDAQFQAPGVLCKNMFFTGVGGARIHCNYACPASGKGKHPGLLVFHGYTGAAAGFMRLLPYVYSGFVVAAMDVRGQGGASQDTSGPFGPTVFGHIVNGLHDPDPAKLFFRNVFLDTAELADIIMNMQEVDPDRMCAMGGSQGGALTLACAALQPRLKRSALCYPFLCDYRRVWDMDLDDGAYAGLRAYFRHFDPTHERQEEIFTKLGYIDLQHLAPRIRASVLMGTGLLDKVCPPSSQFAAYNKIVSPKELVVYPDFGHEDLTGFEERSFNFLKALL